MAEEGPAGPSDIDGDRSRRSTFIGEDVRDMRWIVYLEDSTKVSAVGCVDAVNFSLRVGGRG